MVINIANFNFGGDGGGGGKPALLQEKTATIVQNGSQTITPDEGFDGMSSVQINAAITGESSAIDFSQIGYNDELSAEVNAKLNDDVAYSKTLYDAWNPSTTSAAKFYSGYKKLVYAPNIDTSNVHTMYAMFSGCTSMQTVPSFNTIKVNDTGSMFYNCYRITSVPLFNTSNVERMSYMFYNCSGLTSVPSFDTSNATNMSNMFYYCTRLTTIPTFTTSNVTNMDSMFYNCSGLTSVPTFTTSNVTNMRYMFYNCENLTSIPEMDTSNVNDFQFMLNKCDKLKTIEGISFKSYSLSTMRSNYLIGNSSNYSIRKAVFKDIGYNSSTNNFELYDIRNWGVNTDEIPDARQSLIDSLITYSFDRATAGYPTCTIGLSSNTKALLTEDEKAQITAKGFTIA